MKSTILKTNHGEIKLPAFMPDATYGSINSVTFQDAAKAGVEAIVTTTLHLEMYLGSEYIKEFAAPEDGQGGLHKFFNWNKPILTDSGGFQVFSLIHSSDIKENYINDEGAFFRNPLNGTMMKLTPETSQQIQHNLGSDIRVVLDDPIAGHSTKEELLNAVNRTTDWARRSKNEFLKLNNLTEEQFNNREKFNRPLLMAVVQGGDDESLRKKSLEELLAIGFDGYNWGGWPIDSNGNLNEMVGKLIPQMVPDDKICYAMGVGTPDDIAKCIEWGWDMFDCVLPTRNARHGYLYMNTGEGDTEKDNFSIAHLKNEKYKFDNNSINKNSKFEELRENSKAYLRHLIRNKENSGKRLATLNNLEFYADFIKKYQK